MVAMGPAEQAVMAASAARVRTVPRALTVLCRVKQAPMVELAAMAATAVLRALEGLAEVSTQAMD